ncbi:MAG: CvpA family protein [Deltaproteobacteria bacterium]|nr:CvpA family protein [Deltaproteobacteria bacterium]
MNVLDIIIISVMIFFIVKGVFRGFIREVASLSGIILGIWLANQFQAQVTAYLKPHLPATSYLPLISFAAIFIFILIVCNVLGWALKLFFSKVFLGWLDRTLGAGLAVLKGVILTYLVIVLLTFFLPARTPLIAESMLAPWIVVSYQSVVGLISPDHYEKWKEELVGKARKMGGVADQKVQELKKKR